MEEMHEARLHREKSHCEATRSTRVRSLLVVLGAIAALLSLAFAFHGGHWALGLVILAIVTATLAGKFAVFFAFASGEQVLGYTLPHYSPYTLGFLVFFLDSITAILMTYNFDLMYRIPGIGSKIETARQKGTTFLQLNRWFRKVAYLGVVLFVFFPLSGTGAIAGSILGNLMGVPRMVLIALIMIGGALGGFGFAAGADFFRQDFERLVKHPLTEAFALVVLGLLILWFFLKLRRFSSGARPGLRREIR